MHVLARTSEIYIINAIDNGSIVRKDSVAIGCRVAEFLECGIDAFYFVVQWCASEEGC